MLGREDGRGEEGEISQQRDGQEAVVVSPNTNSQVFLLCTYVYQDKLLPSQSLVTSSVPCYIYVHVYLHVEGERLCLIMYCIGHHTAALYVVMA